jgi:proteasome activator subunit 4
MKHLSVMVNALENYFHPSNHGAWTPILVQFLHSLTSEFLKRCLYEERDSCVIPVKLRITGDMKREFVSLCSQSAFLAMFGRDSGCVSSAQFSLRNLAWIDGNVLIKVLDDAYGALEGVNAHRTVSCIGALGVLTGPLIYPGHYEDGIGHVLGLCEMVLPGIDINDPGKSVVSLRFLERIGMGVVFGDEYASVIVGFLDRIFKMVRLKLINSRWKIFLWSMGRVLVNVEAQRSC